MLTLVSAVGLVMGKLRIGKLSLGITFVFFVGILAAHFGVKVNVEMNSFAQTLGLTLFVYALGVEVGPSFFPSLKKQGLLYNALGLMLIVTGLLLVVILHYTCGVSMPNMLGIMSGAVTNTPMLAAVQSTLQDILGASGTREVADLALACALTYPLGVVGVILAMVFIRKFFVKPHHLEVSSLSEADHTYIAQFTAVNPAIVGKKIEQIARMTHLKFIISRIWRGKQVIVPLASTVIEQNDSLLVVTTKEDEEAMELLFGQKVEKDWNKQDVDWNHIDSKVESRTCIITRKELNGKRLGNLHLRVAYGINVSRVLRGDVKLLASDDLRLQYGDRLTVVGEHEDVNNAEHFLGNSVKTLEEPNIGSIFLGLVLGLAIGTIPISLPGMDSPIRLGIAGGPIIMGIIVGALGPRMHFISYTTRSVSLMLRKLGLALYLGCLGLSAGKNFLSTIIRPEGIEWVGIGFLITVVPVIIIGIIALKTNKYDFGTICGIMCGSMANSMALDYASDTLKDDTASISYATTYPLGVFIRIVIAQVLIMFLA